MTKPHRLYLVDGSGYIFRAFHALPPMTRPDGTPINAVYGFCQMILKLMDDADGDAVAVVFDSARETFRNEIYPEYKAHRPEPPAELVPQFPLFREAVAAFGLPSMELPGFEADDLIATYARQAAGAGIEVVIVSSDKDLMQLVRPGVTMLDPIRNRRIGPDEVAEKFGVSPNKVVDIQALMGDATDNVPGVPGIGAKTAALLIGEYGDLDTLLARAHEIKQPKRRQSLIEHADQARMSRDLVRLREDAPVVADIPDLVWRKPDPEVALRFLEAQGFKSLVARLTSRWAADGSVARAPAALTAENDYELVTEIERLEAWLADATREGILAFDTETTSLDACRATLVGFSLAVRPGRACYVPLAHILAERQIALKDALAALRGVFEDAAVLKIGHNIKYDLVVLAGAYAAAGEATPPRAVAVDDTMLLSYALDAGRNGHGLDELAERHLGYKTITFEEVVGKGRTAITFDAAPLDKALEYAAEDADVTLRLHRVLRPRLPIERVTTIYETVERPLVPIITAMERAGIAVDRDQLEAASRHFTARAARFEARAYALAGAEFNLGSPKQIGEILFDRMGLGGGRKGKSGAYTTSAGVLEDLAAQGHELPRVILEWRHVTKLKSTYADALVEQINPRTGRVHTAYGMAIAQTGRLSSTDPNLQNIPVRTDEGRKIRRAFIAEPGNRLISLDYSQIELRILAHVTGSEALLQAFHEGRDIHAATAAQVFGVDESEVDRDLRRRAKSINFGIIYGISAFGLARNIGVGRGEAQAYIDAYFARYPGIRDYMGRTVAFARKHGFVRTLFGRKIHMRGIHDKSPTARNFAERQAINAPLQGAAADIIKRAMVRMPRALAEAELRARMLLQVHDELVFEAPTAEVERTIATCRAIMEHAPEPAAKLAVPLVVDAGVGESWDEAH